MAIKKQERNIQIATSVKIAGSLSQSTWNYMIDLISIFTDGKVTHFLDYCSIGTKRQYPLQSVPVNILKASKKK
jgi:hypothetical protein